jgi:hypothetical protein
MLILMAVLQRGPFPGRVRKREIATLIAARARRSAVLARDFSVNGHDPTAIEQLLNEDAFPSLAAIGQGRFLREDTEFFDSSPLGTELPGVLATLTHELVAYHFACCLKEATKSSTQLPPMRDDDGSTVDARFDVETVGERTSVVFHSRGGKMGSPAARNTEYRKGLEILLRRLAKASLTIAQIEVISDEVRDRLSAKQRVIELPEHSFPLQMKDVAGHLALARAIGNAAKKVGQKKEATGGNDTRRIRITLVESVPPGELWALLFR